MSVERHWEAGYRDHVMRRWLKYRMLAGNVRPRILARAVVGLCRTHLFGANVLRGIDIAVTYRCPARCTKCSAAALADPSREELSAAAIIAISQRAVDAGALMINLTGGEPLLRGDLTALIGQLSDLPAFVSLSTMGQGLSKDMLLSLRSAGLSVVQVNVSSPAADEHDTETGISGSHANALAVIDMARSLGLTVLMNTVVTREVLYSDRIALLSSYAQSRGCLLSLVLPSPVGKWKHADIQLTTQDMEVINRWLIHDHITIDTKTCYRGDQCPAGTEKAYISAYGDVYPCPFIHRSYGNALAEDFAAIWKRMSTASGSRPCSLCVNIARTEQTG